MWYNKSTFKAFPDDPRHVAWKKEDMGWFGYIDNRRSGWKKACENFDHTAWTALLAEMSFHENCRRKFKHMNEMFNHMNKIFKYHNADVDNTIVSLVNEVDNIKSHISRKATNMVNHTLLITKYYEEKLSKVNSSKDDGTTLLKYKNEATNLRQTIASLQLEMKSLADKSTVTINKLKDDRSTVLDRLEISDKKEIDYKKEINNLTIKLRNLEANMGNQVDSPHKVKPTSRYSLPEYTPMKLKEDYDNTKPQRKVPKENTSFDNKGKKVNFYQDKNYQSGRNDYQNENYNDYGDNRSQTSLTHTNPRSETSSQRHESYGRKSGSMNRTAKQNYRDFIQGKSPLRNLSRKEYSTSEYSEEDSKREELVDYRTDRGNPHTTDRRSTNYGNQNQRGRGRGRRNDIRHSSHTDERYREQPQDVRFQDKNMKSEFP